MPLLDVQDLTITLDRKVVKNLSFTINEGEIVGLVGETGTGKTLTAESILRLNEGETTGKILFKGEDLLTKSEKELADIRGNKIGMIFQDSATAFDPILQIGEQLTEGMYKHLSYTKEHALSHAVDLLFRLGIDHPMRRLEQYPHELSGGIRQRILLAMAIACNPELLIADEPTTSLDVISKGQMLALLKNLGVGVLFITHDLHMINKIASRIYVMYEGKIVEEVEGNSFFKGATHPFTKQLIKDCLCLK